jgi:methylmalonyl-CoA/ethylmalonyl-CoA epimerase
MAAIKRIHHVALVVDDLEAALAFWRDALGLTVGAIEDMPDQDARIAFLPLGEAEIELVVPTTDDSGVARFLAKRGPAMHHVCLEVDDLADTLRKLRERQVRLIDDQPRIGANGRRMAFIHPESTHGVLVELYELP